MFVGRAGFEPTKTKVSGVTVRPSWPLWYLPNTIIFKEPSRWRDSNPRPADYKSAALASWATSAFISFFYTKKQTAIFNGLQMYKVLSFLQNFYVYFLFKIIIDVHVAFLSFFVTVFLKLPELNLQLLQKSYIVFLQ